MAFRLHVVVESISDDYNFKLSSRISPLNLNTMLFIPSKYHYAYVHAGRATSLSYSTTYSTRLEGSRQDGTLSGRS